MFSNYYWKYLIIVRVYLYVCLYYVVCWLLSRVTNNTNWTEIKKFKFKDIWFRDDDYYGDDVEDGYKEKCDIYGLKI